jgi:hypothetical protein
MQKLLSIMIILFIGCGTTLCGYKFVTNAVYRADKSKITVNIRAIGEVSAGNDIGKGRAKGTIISSNFPDTIHFRIRNDKLTELQYKEEKIEMSNPHDISSTFMYCFDKIGYTSYNKDEIIELAKLIMACTNGPKATYMDGQTDLIQVISVDFKRD